MNRLGACVLRRYGVMIAVVGLSACGPQTPPSSAPPPQAPSPESARPPSLPTQSPTPQNPAPSAAATGDVDANLAKCSDMGGDNAPREAACTAVAEAAGAEPRTRAIGYNNRGVMRFQSGDKDGAMSDYDAALKLNPQYPAAFYNRAEVWRAKGDTAHAEADMADAVRLQPGLKGR
jgi:hypothetical protein